VVLFYLVRPIHMVPQGYNYTVALFGKYVRTLEPGLGIIIPFIDRVGAKQNMMEQVLDNSSQEVITRDNAMVKVDGVTFFQIVDAPRATYEVCDLNNAITNLVMTNIRTVMGSMDLYSLLSQRDKRAAVLEAEGLRAAAILKAEGEKQSVVLEAEGRKEAAFRDAEARERSAEAEAKATQLVSAAIGSGGAQAINYFVANNYVKALETLAASPNQKVLMLPLEATSLLGSISGIAEIAKEAFGGQAPAVPRRRGSVPESGSGA
jgi:regulator of protease activity HflC (stomatin/prohibitin superfamily)